MSSNDLKGDIMSTLDDYRTTANNLFTTLPANDSDFTAFTKGTNYWQIGCAFDTVTDYLLQDASFGQQRKVEPQDVQTTLKDIYTHYQSLVQTQDFPAVQNGPGNPNYCWYDDFGWWGIACAKALWPSYADLFGDQARKYQQVALATWEIMKNGKYDNVHYGAPNVWTACQNNDTDGVFKNCKPRFPGGVWQYDIFSEFRPLDHTPPYCNPSTPVALPAQAVVSYGPYQASNLGPYNALSLGPFQNTVTNGLYFVLANRMNAAGYESQETVDAIFGFFNSWFHDPSLSDEQRLNQTVEGCQLIGERVSTYKDGSRVYWSAPPTAWGGDQGLVLGALAEYKRDHPEATWIDPMLKDIMGGVAISMKAPGAGHSYMMPWYPLGDDNKLKTADESDYSSGVGVYMRYLNYTYGFDSTIKKALDDEGNPMRQLVLDSAAVVQAGQFPQFKPRGNPTPLFYYFNQLAIMVMAISLLKNGENEP